MSRLYALVGTRGGDVLSYGGRAIVHDNRVELEYLFPTTRVVECPRELVPSSIRLPAHPDMAGISFPLRREDFR